jgi:phosphonate transport system substrate-binding protein
MEYWEESMHFLHRMGAIALSVCFLFPFAVQAKDKYRLGLAPVLGYKETLKTYQPLADYLSRAAGIELELAPARGFLGYWAQMRKPGAYDFVLDGAHLAAYRMEKMSHRPLAKVGGVLSFTLISRPDDLILDADELVNRRVAVMPSPNLGGLKVYSMFPYPARQPLMVEAKTAVDAIEAVRSGRADAAYVPTPMLTRYPEATVITSSEPMPNMTMTAAPEVPPVIAMSVARALLEARDSVEGRTMLKAVNISGFEPVGFQEYQGLAQELTGMWGY